MKPLKLCFARFEFKFQDCWIGVFWKNSSYQCDVWIIAIPMFPLHICWLHGWRKLRRARREEAETKRCIKGFAQMGRLLRPEIGAAEDFGDHD